MVDWKRIGRIVPLFGLAAASAYILANRPFNIPSNGYSLEERAERQERGSSRAKKCILYGTALSLGALAAAHAVRRIKGKKPAILQPAVENPFWSGMAAGVSYGIAAYSQLPNSSDAAYALLPAAGAGIPAWLLSNICKDYNPPYLVNFAKTVCSSLQIMASKDPVKKQEILEKSKQGLAMPERADFDIVDLLFEQERVDEACRLLKKTMNSIGNIIPSTKFRRYFVFPLSAELQRRENPLANVYCALRQGDLEGALNAADSFAAEKTPDKLAARAYVLQSIMDIMPVMREIFPNERFDELSLAGRSNSAWHEAAALILSDPAREKKFKVIGESRNEVLEYAASSFLKGLLVFKRCDSRQSLRIINECENMHTLEAKLGRQIAKSLTFIVHDSKAYHIMMHGTSRTLEDVMKNGTPDEQLKSMDSAAHLLAKIHQSRIPAPVNAPIDSYYCNRLSSCFYDQLADSPLCREIPASIANEFSFLGSRVREELEDAPTGWYKDANPRNWLVEDDGTVVAIDFEHRMRLPVVFDLVSLLEFSSVPVPNLIRDRVISHYLTEFYSNNKSPVKKFTEHYNIAALQRHLELAGYRARDRDAKAVAFHIDRAQAYAFGLGEDIIAEKLGKIVIDA
jgi:hypothetical protein